MTSCCDKHASEHEQETLAWIEAAGMRLYPVARARRDQAAAETGDWVLIHPDGRARVHGTWLSAVHEAELAAQVAGSDTAGKLKLAVVKLLTEYGVLDHRPSLEGGIFAAIDAFAAAKAKPGGK